MRNSEETVEVMLLSEIHTMYPIELLSERLKIWLTKKKDAIRDNDTILSEKIRLRLFEQRKQI